MRQLPNFLSFGRIILSVLMIFTKPLGAAFYVLYITSGISDMLDGYIARRTGTTSAFGARIDSIADLVMTIILLIKLYPILNPPVQLLILVLFIGVIRATSMLVAMLKYRTFAILHTYGNKITGFLLLIFPLLLLLLKSSLLTYIICFVASISALEELLIQISSKKLELDRQSIFWQ